jgi:hypothetical protein
LPRRKQKPRKQKLGPVSQRSPDIRTTVNSYVENLVELYENTDPARENASEEDKLELARQAISKWWYLYGDLLLWAQSQIAGYEYCKSNLDIVEQLSKTLGHEITGDSHALEYIGLRYSANRVNANDPMMEKVHAVMDNAKADMDNVAMRALIRELLMSNSANSSFWRHELVRALFALNLGHVDEILRPEPTRRQGDPIQLLRWKMAALQQVYFHVGKGLKKYRALQLVAEALGQSSETLRSWEKFMSGDDDLRMDLVSAELAGELEADFDKYPIADLILKHSIESHRDRTDVEYAERTLKNIRSTSMNEIRDGLRRGRIIKTSSS